MRTRTRRSRGGLDTDDSVGMYLRDMGQIATLNRAEQIATAKQVEHTRARYRHGMLATDSSLQGAIHLLERVRDGRLRMDSLNTRSILRRRRNGSCDSGGQP